MKNTVVKYFIFLLFAGCATVGNKTTNTALGNSYIEEIKSKSISSSEFKQKTADIKDAVVKLENDSVKYGLAKRVENLECRYNEALIKNKNETRTKVKKKISVIAPLTIGAVGLVYAIQYNVKYKENNDPPPNWYGLILLPAVGYFTGLCLAEVSNTIIGGEDETKLHRSYILELNKIIKDFNSMKKSENDK